MWTHYAMGSSRSSDLLLVFVSASKIEIIRGVTYHPLVVFLHTVSSCYAICVTVPFLFQLLSLYVVTSLFLPLVKGEAGYLPRKEVSRLFSLLARSLAISFHKIFLCRVSTDIPHEVNSILKIYLYLISPFDVV